MKSVVALIQQNWETFEKDVINILCVSNSEKVEMLREESVVTQPLPVKSINHQ